jgi:DNA-binding response OmpR family regulator
LLDIELPDGNGINYCSELNSSYPNIPIFILTSHSQLSDKVLGFSAGADDYITKPFEILELKARIESRLKKIQIRKETNLILKWKEIEIDKNKQIVKVFEKHDSYEVNLTALEFKLLCYLAEKPGFVFPRDKVLNDIWGTDVYIYPRSVDTHISKLRKKLGSVSEIIESVHGSGYKFIPTT